MINSLQTKKIKIRLSDYAVESDLKNRLLLSLLSKFDVEVLEEIIYSPLKILLSKLASQVGCQIDCLMPSLMKLQKGSLLTIENGAVLVDKKMRKYYEHYLPKFFDDFKPDMLFFQEILKKAPIQVLPAWYAIPRTSDNIFQSLREKYLQTPVIYERYLAELKTVSPIIRKILKAVFEPPEFAVTAAELCEKLKLKREKLEEHLIYLEFSCAACVIYREKEGKVEEAIVPFYEWQNYLKSSRRPKLPADKIQTQKSAPFAFIQALSRLLKELPKESTPQISSAQKLNFIENGGGQMSITAAAKKWLKLSQEKKAHYIYRSLFCLENSHDLTIAEAALSHAALHGWTTIDAFINGTAVAFFGRLPLSLQQTGKSWIYKAPQYSAEELAQIRTVILEKLFEAGLAYLVNYEEEIYFNATPLGRKIFGIEG